MSARKPFTAAEILARYAAGFFPLYDMDDRFYWERLSIRAILPLTPDVLTRAERMSRRSRDQFEIRYTTAVEEIIVALRNKRIKPRTWVRAEVVTIYRTLHQAGLLQTIEVWDKPTNQLAGAVVGLVLPGVFIAETMFGTTPDASKVALCQLVADAHAAGHYFMDVQTPHHLDENGLPRSLSGKTPHPCIRLGEKILTLATFLRLFHNAMRQSFAGNLTDWLEISTALAQNKLPTVPPKLLHSALPMLRNNVTHK